jgi:Zn-finger nucleic acid-binding protein
MDGQRLCPKCGLPLRRWAVDTAVAEGCLQCGGVLVSPSVYQFLRHNPSAASVLDDAFADQSPIPLLASEMPCPQCGALMQSLYLAEAPNVSVERCPDCGVFWFDDGELTKLAQALSHRPSLGAPPEETVEDEAVLPEIIHCAHCGRENFSDALECWACGEPLTPEPPPLPSFWHRLTEGLTMLIGGAGALLFSLFIVRPKGEVWAAVGLVLMVSGLSGLALLRRTWRRPRRSGIFPGFSE